MAVLTHVLKSYLQLIRPLTALLAALGVFVGGILGGFHLVSVSLVLAMIVAFFMVAGSMALNDYLDRAIDQHVHPHRPIPSGGLSPRGALHFAYISFFIALVLSASINILSFGIVVVSICLLVIYEQYLKNIGLIGNILAGFISGMALIFGGAAVGHVHNTLLLAAMTFLIMLGREILKDIQDIKGDRIQRVTLPMNIGQNKALYVGCSLVTATIALTPFPYWLNILNIWYIVIIVPAGVLFAYSILLVLRDIKHIGVTIEILRSGSAFALAGFVLGVI